MERYRLIAIAVTVVALAAVLTSSGSAQQVMGQKVEIVDAQGVFNFSELGAVVIESDSTLTFAHAMPGANRPQAYRAVDVQQGDTLLMVNGKRVRTAESLQELYDKLAAGETLKLGLRRGKDLLVASFAKADPANLPKMKFQVMTDDDGEPSTDEPAGGRMMMLDGSDPNLLPLLELGLIVKQTEQGLKVAKVLPNAAEVFNDAVPSSGSVLMALNGQPVKTADGFKEAYEKLKAGEKMTLDYRDRGNERSIAITVPEKSGARIWKKSGE